MRRSIVLAVALVVAASAIVGTVLFSHEGDEVLSDGPVKASSYSEAEWCFRVQRGDRMSFGATAVSNVTEHPIELESVELKELNGMRLLGSQLLAEKVYPNGNREAPGFVNRYPPGGEHWRKAVDIDGAVIEPSETHFLVFGVELDEDSGSTESVMLSYRWNGAHYSVTIPHTYLAGSCDNGET